MNYNEVRKRARLRKRGMRTSGRENKLLEINREKIGQITVLVLLFVLVIALALVLILR